LLFIVILASGSASDSGGEKFDLIFRKYKNLMLHKAYEILKDPYLAEDAVSDAFLRIYRNIGKIDNPLSNQSVAFIVTVVRNTALTIYRKSARAKSESAEIELLENTPDEGFDLESYVISNIEAKNIYTLIDRLNEKYKQVFLLKYAYGYSHREIAGLTGMTEGNAVVTLHRAKKALMQLISEHNEGNGPGSGNVKNMKQVKKKIKAEKAERAL